MSLLGKLLSLFRAGSSGKDVDTEPEPEPESEAEHEEPEEHEADDEGEEAEEDGAMHSGELAAADPRRDPSEDDTVADRATNPDDHAA